MYAEDGHPQDSLGPSAGLASAVPGSGWGLVGGPGRDAGDRGEARGDGGGVLEEMAAIRQTHGQYSGRESRR